MIRKNSRLNKSEIAIYRPKSGEIEFKVKLGKDTVWLSLDQIAKIFDRDKSVISRHLRNIFKEKELSKNSVVAKIATTAADGKTYQVEFYNLDAIISVGYRVNSQKATQFRIWATGVLRKYLLNGYVVNERQILEARGKFEELRNAISFLQKKSKEKLLKGQEKEILNLLADYSKTLTLLERYDKKSLKKSKGGKAEFVLEYEKCRNIIIEIKKELMAKKEAGDIFGSEVDKKFESIVRNIYQSFSKRSLYQTMADKAAHLLYLTIKDHPFIDGNKRIASFLFVYFLDKNNYLYRENGERKINDNALVAIALLVAVSDPKEKDQMIALISQLLE